MIRAIFILCLALTEPIWACAQYIGAWNGGLDFARIEFELADLKVLKVTPLKDYLEAQGRKYRGTAEAYVIVLENGTKGVAKLSDDPKPLRAAHGAYQISRVFGFDLVPPTVLREFKCFGKRTALFQYLVENTYDVLDAGQRGTAYSNMTPKHRSDLIVLKVLLGRWDNNKSNELVDETGTPALIDSDEILDLQQLQYGDFPYIKYGDRLTMFEEDLDTWKPFLFDNPHKLDRINYELLRWRFAVYLDNAAMRKLYHEWTTRQFQRDVIQSIDWNGHTWIRWAMKGQRPLYTTVYSSDTIENISLVDASDLRNVLSPAFSDLHIQLMLDRRDQLVRDSNKRELIP